MIKVCIIGSGFGGSALAYALTKDKRFKVTIIEKEKVNNSYNGVRFVKSLYANHRNRQLFYIGEGGGSNIWHGVLTHLDQAEINNYYKNERINFQEIIKKYNYLALNFFGIKKNYFNKSIINNVHKIKSIILKSKIFELKKFIVQKKPFNCNTLLLELIKNNNLEFIKNIEDIKFNLKKKKIISIKIVSNKLKSEEKEFDLFVVAAGALETPQLLFNLYLSNKIKIPNYLGKFLDDHPQCIIGEITSLNNFLYNSLGDVMLDSKNILRGGFILKDLKKNQLNSCLVLRPFREKRYQTFRDLFIEFIKKGKINLRIFNIKFFLFLLFETFSRKMICKGFVVHILINVKLSKKRKILFNNKFKCKNEKIIKKIMFPFGKREMQEICKYQSIFQSLFDESDYIFKKYKLNNIRIYSAAHFANTCSIGAAEKGFVVDKNLKVHNLENLYVCDNSIQKFTGNSNVTLTLILFAFRLASYFKKKINF